ncbi:BrnT family toxin [Patescibacteria group bacterium]|nr:BrnT family toxin [Patescibacteria group bacterium]
MIILPGPLAFEWDKGNVDKSFLRHQVTNQEAEEVFVNEPKFIIEDDKHSLMEKRYLLWGKTNVGRKLAVIFTFRVKKIRIISARDMNQKERRSYAQKI